MAAATSMRLRPVLTAAGYAADAAAAWNRLIQNGISLPGAMAPPFARRCYLSRFWMQRVHGMSICAIIAYADYVTPNTQIQAFEPRL